MDIAKKRINNIKTYENELTVHFQEIPKPKIPFGQLVESNYIKTGEKLYSTNKKYWAIVMADGTLKNGKHSGSIHTVSAKVLNKESHNGWDFWNVERRGKLISIDQFREKYFNDNV